MYAVGAGCEGSITESPIWHPVAFSGLRKGEFHFEG